MPLHLLPPWHSLPPVDTGACGFLEQTSQGVRKALEDNAEVAPCLWEYAMVTKGQVCISRPGYGDLALFITCLILAGLWDEFEVGTNVCRSL